MFWFSCEKGEECGVTRATSQNGLYLPLSSSAGSSGGVTGLWRTWRPVRAAAGIGGDLMNSRNSEAKSPGAADGD